MRSLFSGLLLATFLGFACDVAAGERVVFGNDKLSVELPDGWKKSELNQAETLIGWESPDQSTSAFIQKMNVSVGISLSEMMDEYIDKFDANEGFLFEKASELKSGEVRGPGDEKWPAIFATLDLTLKATPEDFAMKFYLLIFDTGSAQYYLQANTTRPIRDTREKQIMALIKSLVARR